MRLVKKEEGRRLEVNFARACWGRGGGFKSSSPYEGCPHADRPNRTPQRSGECELPQAMIYPETHTGFFQLQRQFLARLSTDSFLHPIALHSRYVAANTTSLRSLPRYDHLSLRPQPRRDRLFFVISSWFR